MPAKLLYAILLALAIPVPDVAAQMPAQGTIPIVQGPVVRQLPTTTDTPATVPVVAQPRNTAPAPAMAPPPAQYVPASTAPAEQPNVPYSFGSMQGSGSGPLVSLPPHVPQYLPNGASNLDWYWTEDGGARLYWNEVLIPQQLKMDGARWVDPALVPQLFPERYPATRRYWRRRPVAKKKIRSTAPVAASSRKLKTPAIPIPVEENKPAKEAPKASIPPLTAPRVQESAPAHPVANGAEENIDVIPPRLQ